MSSVTLEGLVLDITQKLKGAGIEEAHQEALLILSQISSKDLGYLIARFKDPVPNNFPIEKVWSWCHRRCQHEPKAYIIGEREFFGRPFQIGPGALIPRPDTETLIEWVIDSHRQKPYKNMGIDLCCGPGTLAITLSHELNLPFYAADVSLDALSWCKKNVISLQREKLVKVLQLDVLEAALDQKLPKTDLIVCNPPYIPAPDHTQLMPDVREYEPSLALIGGEHGLEFFYLLLNRLHLIANPGCHLYVELGMGQHEEIDKFTHPHWTRDTWREDLAGIPRVIRFIF
jgi:release factor glutamine methyltransferase